MTDRVIVFDSKSSEPLFKTPEGEQAIPSLHITSPDLSAADFRSTFEVNGFFARAAYCEELFVGRYSASEENGVVIDAQFFNPKMQEAAMRWEIADRPATIYWHDIDLNDPSDGDGGLEYELNVKAMAAAVGGRV